MYYLLHGFYLQKLLIRLVHEEIYEIPNVFQDDVIVHKLESRAFDK